MSNYRITTRSRIGMHSQVANEAHVEASKTCVSVCEMLDFIRTQAMVEGWRDFTVETIGDALAGIPYEVPRPGMASHGCVHSKEMSGQ